MAENTFQLNIISPEGLFYEGRAEFVEFTTTSGEMGVYARHLPTTVILKPCKMRIHVGGKVKEVEIGGGFVQILKTEITVMAESAYS